MPDKVSAMKAWECMVRFRKWDPHLSYVQRSKAERSYALYFDSFVIKIRIDIIGKK
jgi:hypothetical protein